MQILFYIISLLEFALLVRVLLSATKKEECHPIAVGFCSSLEIVLKPVRKVLPSNKVGIDPSPIIIFLILEIIKQILFKQYF